MTGHELVRLRKPTWSPASMVAVAPATSGSRRASATTPGASGMSWSEPAGLMAMLEVMYCWSSVWMRLVAPWISEGTNSSSA